MSYPPWTPKCYVCLLQDRGSVMALDAVTLVKGTAVCLNHLREIANADLLALAASRTQPKQHPPSYGDTYGI